MNFIRKAYLGVRLNLADHWPSVYRLCERRKAIIKFVLVGCLSGGLDLFLLYIFHSRWSWGIVWSTSVAFIFAFLVSFTLQKLWTFRDYRQDRLVGQLFLYLGNAFIGLNLNGLFMYLLVARLGWWYMLAQIAVNLLIATQNFLVYKFIVFRPEAPKLAKSGLSSLFMSSAPLINHYQPCVSAEAKMKIKQKFDEVKS